MPLQCCQLVRKGRFVAAEPWFDGGALVSIANAKRYHGDVGKLAIVAVTRAVGYVVEVLGPEDDIHAVMRGLLADRGAFGAAPAPGRELGELPADVARQLDDLSAEVPLLEAREDLRSQLCVTIDPPGARDHDDAVGLEQPAPGSAAIAIVWVHIADVSAYVLPGSPLDLYALDRAMSVYVPGTVAPMLPGRLSSDLCSLVPGVDRGCVSARIELGADGAPLGVRFARTVIRSARRLTYDQVDRVLEAGPDRVAIVEAVGAAARVDGVGGEPFDPVIAELLHSLDTLTSTVRARRMLRGALDMQLPDVAFVLGETTPTDARLEPESPSHRLIEECMLLSNEAVGGRLAQAQVPAIYRAHDDPDPTAIEHLIETMTRLGVPTPPLPDVYVGPQAAAIAAAAARLAQQYSASSGRGRYAFAPRVLRALKQAEYRAVPTRHSGLASTNYLHFTSPIRRYPDIVNHRSLLALIGAAREGEQPAAVIQLQTVAAQVSTVERESMAIERRANDIVLAHLLHLRLFGSGSARSFGPDSAHGRTIDPGTCWPGEITGMIGSGLFVRFGEVFEGFVPARTLSPDERHELDEHGLAMAGGSSGERLQLGDQIKVVVHAVNRATGKVELRRAGHGAQAEAGADAHARERAPGQAGRNQRGRAHAPRHGGGASRRGGSSRRGR